MDKKPENPYSRLTPDTKNILKEDRDAHRSNILYGVQLKTLDRLTDLARCCRTNLKHIKRIQLSVEGARREQRLYHKLSKTNRKDLLKAIKAGNDKLNNAITTHSKKSQALLKSQKSISLSSAKYSKMRFARTRKGKLLLAGGLGLLTLLTGGLAGAAISRRKEDREGKAVTISKNVIKSIFRDIYSKSLILQTIGSAITSVKDALAGFLDRVRSDFRYVLGEDLATIFDTIKKSFSGFFKFLKGVVVIRIFGKLQRGILNFFGFSDKYIKSVSSPLFKLKMALKGLRWLLPFGKKALKKKDELKDTIKGIGETFISKNLFSKVVAGVKSWFAGGEGNIWDNIKEKISEGYDTVKDKISPTLRPVWDASVEFAKIMESKMFPVVDKLVEAFINLYGVFAGREKATRFNESIFGGYDTRKKEEESKYQEWHQKRKEDSDKRESKRDERRQAREKKRASKQQEAQQKAFYSKLYKITTPPKGAKSSTPTAAPGGGPMPGEGIWGGIEDLLEVFGAGALLRKGKGLFGGARKIGRGVGGYAKRGWDAIRGVKGAAGLGAGLEPTLGLGVKPAGDIAKSITGITGLEGGAAVAGMGAAAAGTAAKLGKGAKFMKFLKGNKLGLAFLPLTFALPYGVGEDETPTTGQRSGSALGALGGGIMGEALTGVMAGRLAGGALGTLLGGPIGTLAGGMLGSVIGGYLGSIIGKEISEPLGIIGKDLVEAGTLLKDAVVAIAGYIQPVWDWVIKPLMEQLGSFLGDLLKIMHVGFVVAKFALRLIADPVGTISDAVQSLAGWFKELPGRLWDWIKEGIKSYLPWNWGNTDKTVQPPQATTLEQAAIDTGMPVLNTGGLVTEPGPAYLHAGERVLNPEQTEEYDEMPSFAKGGMVDTTGPARVHAGERVLNKQQTRALERGFLIDNFSYNAVETLRALEKDNLEYMFGQTSWLYTNWNQPMLDKITDIHAAIMEQAVGGGIFSSIGSALSTAGGAIKNAASSAAGYLGIGGGGGGANAGGIINGYDLSRYNTHNPEEHLKFMREFVAKHPEGTFDTPEKVNDWIQKNYPNSPFAGQGAEMLAYAKQKGVPMSLVMGTMQKESQLGTTGNLTQQAKNVGNIVAGKYYPQYGTVGANKFTAFPNWMEGYQGMVDVLERKRVTGGVGGIAQGASEFVKENQLNPNTIRNKPITDQLRGILDAAGQQTGLAAEITSGGQTGDRRTGSNRHDVGTGGLGSADLQLRDIKTGRVLDMSDPNDQARISDYMKLSVAGGATGIGMAPNYMGTKTMHIGGGPAAAWGAGGRSANALPFVQQALQEGLELRKRGRVPVLPETPTTQTAQDIQPATGKTPSELFMQKQGIQSLTDLKPAPVEKPISEAQKSNEKAAEINKAKADEYRDRMQNNMTQMTAAFAKVGQGGGGVVVPAAQNEISRGMNIPTVPEDLVACMVASVMKIMA